MPIIALTKIVNTNPVAQEKATDYSVDCRSAEGLAIDLQLRTTAGAALDAVGYTVWFSFQREGTGRAFRSPGVVGISTGLFQLRQSADYLDGNYRYTIWLQYPSGAVRALYESDWRVDDSVGPEGETGPVGASVVKIYYGAAVAALSDVLIETTLIGANVSRMSDYACVTSPASQKVYVCHPMSLGVLPWTIDGFAIDELSPRVASLHNSDGVFENYLIRESENLLIATAKSYILELSHA